MYLRGLTVVALALIGLVALAEALRPQPIPRAWHDPHADRVSLKALTLAPTAVPIATAPPPPPAPTQPAPTQPAPTAERSRYAQLRYRYLPILAYHHIRVVEEGGDPIGFRLSVHPERFAEQMRWLIDNGYSAILMRDLAACLRGQRPCPERPVALTFDDGYANNAEEALPILQRHDLVATFYIVPSLVGSPGYMGWEQLAALRDSGMEIGSHTLTHPDLTALARPAVRRELDSSREVLERRLGVAVVSFSYPAGSYTPALAELVRQAGYESAVIMQEDRHFKQLYMLPRRRVLGGETMSGFPWYFVPLEQLGR